MSNVYDVGIGFRLTGNLGAELRAALRQMEGVEREAQRVARTLDRINLRGFRSEIATARRELAGLSGVGSGRSQFERWAKDLTPSARDLRAMSRAAGTLEGRVDRITRSLSQWPDKISAAASALDRMRTSAPRSSSFSGHGGGGRGGSGGYDAPVRPRGRPHHEERRGSISEGFAGIVGIGAGTHTLQSVIMQGASSNREDLRAKNAGLTPEQNEVLRKTATDIAQKYPSLSRLSVREQGRLLIPNVGDFNTAMAVLPEYIKGQVALQVTAGPEGGQKDMEAFARFVDIIGRSMSKNDTAALIDSFVRFRQLDAEAIKSADFVNAAQSAGTAGKSLSVGFWGTVAPALFSQQKGARTGTDIASAYQNTAIGRATDSAIMAQAQSGWREGFESKIGKTGKPKVVSKGELVDGALYGSNPFEWAKKHVIPDMVRKGLLPEGFGRGDYSQDLTDVQRSGGAKYLSERFSSRRGANIFTMMIQDIEQIDKIIQQRNKARGTADILKDQKADFYVGLEGTKAQAAGAASALSSPSMEKLAAALDRMTTSLSKTADFLEKNPGTAQGAFAGGASVVGGVVAAGAAAITIAAVSALSLPALAVGSIAALTIGTFLFPWEKLYEHMGWKPGIALGGKDVGGKSLNPSDEFPGLSAYDERAKRRAAAIQGLGTTAENVTNALRRQAELTGRVAEAAVPAATAIDRLGDALKGFLQKMGEGMAGAQFMSFKGGGGGGATFQTASFSTGGGANDNGSVARALAIGSGTGVGHIASKADRAAYIKARAASLGIDPSTALRVAQSEGFGTFVGDKGTSFGDFQLHYGGSGIRGMNSMGEGDLFTRATGLSAKDPRNWKAATDWALKRARQNGWGAWHGAGRVGIGNHQGIGTHPVTPMPPSSSSAPIAPPPTAGPPPRQKEKQPIMVDLQMDGRKMGRAMAMHIADDHRFPKKAGGMDTHGSMRSPGTPVSDAA